MPELPDKTQQIIEAHANLIHRVVMACHNRELVREIEPVLKMSAENGWTELVAAIRQVLSGRRDVGVLQGLDEEDTVIVEAILRGIQNPSTLPDPSAKPDPAMAAPGLASMIRAAASGDHEALLLVAHMADQMSKVGGDMARIAAVIRPLINGERDADKLCKGMSAHAKQLVLLILEELAKAQAH